MNGAYWKTTALDQMTPSQWESLCDGCGKCCCLRLEDEDTQEIFVTDISCKLFDAQTCRCANYDRRHDHVPDCVQLTPDNIGRLRWMPRTCAYRLIYEGKDLPEWHHLVSGSRETIHKRAMSVQNAVTNEQDVPEADHIKRIVIWPGEPGHVLDSD